MRSNLSDGRYIRKVSTCSNLHNQRGYKRYAMLRRGLRPMHNAWDDPPHIIAGPKNEEYLKGSMTIHIRAICATANTMPIVKNVHLNTVSDRLGIAAMIGCSHHHVNHTQKCLSLLSPRKGCHFSHSGPCRESPNS